MLNLRMAWMHCSPSKYETPFVNFGIKMEQQQQQQHMLNLDAPLSQQMLFMKELLKSFMKDHAAVN